MILENIPEAPPANIDENRNLVDKAISVINYNFSTIERGISVLNSALFGNTVKGISDDEMRKMAEELE